MSQLKAQMTGNGEHEYPIQSGPGFETMCNASLHTSLRVFKVTSQTNKAKNLGWLKVLILFMSFRPKLRISKESITQRVGGEELRMSD